MIYQNFDLEIICPQGGAQLCARVLESPQGDCPFMNVKWPFGAEEEHELLSEIYGGLRQRHVQSNKGGTIRDFGGKLFEAVFSGDIEHLFRSSLDTAFRSGKGLRIRLRLPEDSALHAKPWEFLFDTESREFLAVREYTPLVRYLPVAQPIPPMSVEGPLRVLVALSSPTDHPRLDIAREWDILQQALGPLISAGQLELRRVPGRCTFDNLRDSLRHFGTHIFHFVGHGLPGALVLEQESGKGLEMEASRLRSAFPGGTLPRLIVLNACSGAIAEDLTLSGLAQGFLKQGVPAVVAMQASITDDAALIFTRYFYRDLVETGAVDTSLTEARLRMQGNGHPIEWGTPVLYMRALSGQLFQPTADPAPTSRLEPELGEPEFPSKARAREAVPGSGTPAYAGRVPGLLVYGLAGGLLAAILALAIGVDKIFPPAENAPPPRAAPVTPAEPAPTLTPSAAMPNKEPLHRPEAQAQAHSPESRPRPKPSTPSPRKAQATSRPAHPRLADNCKNPDISERNANCVFSK